MVSLDIRAAVTAILVAGFGNACASTGSSPGAGGGASGSTGGASSGTSVSGTSGGGSGVSTGGASGTATAGASGTATAGASGTATAGASGTATAGASGGAATDAGGGNPPDAGGNSADAASSGFTCPTEFTGKVPTLAGATVMRIAGVPPADHDGGINGLGYGYSTIEGPVWMGTALLVSEFPGTPMPLSRILEITPSGAVTVAGPAGWDPGTNGLAVDRSGTLFGAVHADGSISRLDVATGTRTPVASSYEGKPFSSPNDLAIRSDGTIYFSDPSGFQSASTPSQSVQRVYRVAPGTNAVSVVDPAPGVTPLNQPNGVTLSLDEKTLYVSSNSAIYAFPVMPDGSTGARPAMPFSTLDIDGMVIDCAGNLYGAEITTSNAVVAVLSPTGSLIGTLAVPNTQSATNVAFGGADHKTLYISALGTGGGTLPPGSSAQGVYQVTLDIPGMPY
jgi:gluconolactonase